ncbi:MAG: ABC transporter permease, partial [Lachnospiraceae bacterium]|nr:ABC transporter permease [Lachnospiraceae bacterium]
AAAVSIHFVGLVLVVIYLKYILKVPVFSKPLPCLAVVFVGCVMGVELGQFASCLARGSEGMTIAISLAISLGSSALSGLMSPDLKRLADRIAPSLSRLNPSSAIADCFYSLSIYSDYTRFTKSLTILIVEAIILVVLSFFAVRRNKYVSV